MGDFPQACDLVEPQVALPQDDAPGVADRRDVHPLGGGGGRVIGAAGLLLVLARTGDAACPACGAVSGRVQQSRGLQVCRRMPVNLRANSGS
jgi:hypothetical protein